MVATPHPSRFFDLWSRVYDVPAVQRLAYRPVHDAVLSDVRRAEPGRVLDVGCGTGMLTSRLRRHHRGQVVGLDYSAGMLAKASRRARAVPWVQGNAMRLPFPDDAFGAVACTESFHWYPDQPTALAEFFRVLQPGGRLLVALMSPPIPLPTPITAGPGLTVRWPTRDGMRRLVGAAGFEVSEQRRIRRGPGGPMLSALLTVGVRPLHR